MNEIAHFIGMLHMNAEQALVRHAYEEFDALKPVEPAPDTPAPGNLPFAAPYEFVGFDPDVPYRSPPPGPMDGDPRGFPNMLPPPPPLSGVRRSSIPLPRQRALRCRLPRWLGIRRVGWAWR